MHRERREKKNLGNKDAQQLLRVRKKKSRGNKDSEKLLRVRKIEKKS